MPWDLPFATLWQEFTDASEGTRQSRESLEKFIAAVSPAAWWISPALLVLSLAAMTRRARDLIEFRQPHVVDVILVLAGGIFVIYLIKLAGLFPKYHITALPFICISAAWLVGRTVGRIRRAEPIAWGSPWLSRPRTTGVRRLEWFAVTFGSLDTLLIIRPLMLLAVLVGLAVIIAGGPVGRHLSMVTAMLVLGWSLAIGWRESRADFSTNYWYGSFGQREAAAFLDSQVAPDEFWGGAKEVAYYARNQNYIDEDTLQYWIEHYGGLKQPISGHVPRVLAVWTGHPYIAWVFHEAVAQEFEPIGEFGTYTVLIRR